MILHTMAELSASATMYGRWAIVVRLLSAGLRCPVCQEHFNTWTAANPPPSGPRGKDERVPVCRAWVLALHNEVNTTKEVPTEPWTVEQVAAKYGGDRATIRKAARLALRSIQAMIVPRAYTGLQNILAQG